MGLLFIPSPILHLYKLCKFSYFLSHSQRSKAFHRDEIILTYFSYRKSLAFNKLIYLLEFIF